MKRYIALILTWALWIPPAVAQEQPATTQIYYAGAPAELSVVKVSDHTIEVQLLPVNSDGEAIQPPPSTVLVEYPRELLWSGRTMEEPVQRKISDLSVEIRPDPLTVILRRADGSVVQTLSWNGEDGAMHFRTEAPAFGLGEGGPQYDRRGELYSMEGGWGAYKRPTHGARIAVPMLIGVDGWSMFVHQPVSQSNTFDLRDGQGVFRPDEAVQGDPLRVLLTVWEEPAQALAEYRLIAGATPMPPKWTMGYIQSHRTLEDAGQMRQIAYTFRSRNLPADALIYLGTGFTPRGWNRGHDSFEFNPEVFDDPAEFIQDMHELNFKVILHTYGAPEGLHGTSVDPSSGEENHIGNYWELHEPAFKLGADGWWPDGGEGLSMEGRLARARMYWLGPLAARPNERPWSLHRTGYSGVHRYGGWIWTGDPDSYWETLKTHIAVGLNHSVSLTPFWGSDTGGFLPSEELTGELYIRWFQFSAFCPLFRSHGRAWHLRLPYGWNTAELGPPEVDAFSDAFEDGYPNPAELKNGLVEPIARQYLQLRYRLLPYNYTLVRLAHDTGMPPMRAMWLHYPDDPQAIRLGNQYLWGRDLLVAPVYEKGATERTLYLPEGLWYDWWTNETVAGGRQITRRVDLATMPIYVRAGTILPMAPVRQYTAQSVSEPVTLRIYPGADGAWRWYRDDGQSMDYTKGEYSWTYLRWDDSAGVLTIGADPGSGGQAPPPTTLRVRLISTGTTDAVQTIEWDGSSRVEVSFAEAGK